MRILFVTQVRLDRPHGGPRHVLAVARAWADAGHEVTLLAPGERPDHPGLTNIVTRGRAPGARLELELAVRVGQLVRSKRPDVAYVRLSATSSAVPLAMAAARVPFLTELNGRLLDELAALGRSERAIAAVGWMQRRIAARAFANVSVEPKIGRHARERLGYREVHVVLNGADVSAATPGDRGEARQRLGLSDTKSALLVFAGTLAPELRLDLLAAALKPLDATLLVAGDGPARARLEALAAADPKIRYLGPRPHAEAIDLLRAADLCINVRDGDMGMKALEYAAVGRRFVAFAVEGSERLTQLYPDHAAAFLVEARSPAALTRAIEAGLAEERRGPLPSEAVAVARDRVSWRRTADAIAELLAAAVST